MENQETDNSKTAPTEAVAPKERRGRKAAGAIVKFIVPLAVTVGLCWIMFHNIDFHEMMQVIKRDCDFRWIGLMLALGLAPMLLRALRWGIQLRASGVDAPVHALVYSIIGCYSLNLVFPRLGEVWRTGYISYREDKPFSTIFGSMIADRFADLLAVGLMTLGTFFVAREPIIDFVRTYPDAYEKLLHVMTSPWMWGTLIAVIAVTWVVLSRSHGRLATKIKGFLKGLWDGFAAIAAMKHKWVWLGLTVCIWGCYYLQLVVAFNAFPVMRELLESAGPMVTLVCYVLTSVAMGIPSNGGIGPYQTVLLFGLNIFLPALGGSISPSDFNVVGAAFGNVIIASQTVLLVVLGLIVFALVTADKHRDMSAKTPAASDK